MGGMWAPRGTRARERPSVGQKEEKIPARGRVARRRDAKTRTRSNVGRVERALAVRVDAAGGENLVAAGWTTRVTRGRGEDVILSYASFRLKKDWLRRRSRSQRQPEGCPIRRRTACPTDRSDRTGKSGNKRSEETREWSRRPRGAVGHPARLSLRLARPSPSFVRADRPPTVPAPPHAPRTRSSRRPDPRPDPGVTPEARVPSDPTPRWRRTTTTSCVA